MMGWYQDGAGWGGWILMAAVMIAFWALVVFAVIAIFQGARRAPTPTGYRHDPLQVLDERFARGEIDESEYHARSGVLRASVH